MMEVCQIVPLKSVRGSPTRMTTVLALQLLLELENKGWDLRVLAGQFVVNTHGPVISAAVQDRIKEHKWHLCRLVRYCEAQQRTGDSEANVPRGTSGNREINGHDS